MSAPTQSIAELITEFDKTTGDVPPLLIGASATLINQHVYVFGGRLQKNRQISNKLYILSLETMIWELAFPHNVPPIPRYFHSANAYNSTHIVIYGGMTAKQRQSRKSVSPDELATLDDIIFLNVNSLAWEYPNLEDQILPAQRYAHIATLANDRLVVMGGQDIQNNYLSDIHIFDCKHRIWSESISSQQLQYGVYRSAIAGVTPMQLAPPFAPNVDLLVDPFDESSVTPKDTDVDIHVYSNYSASDTTKQLHTWKLNTRNQCTEVFYPVEQQTSANAITPPPLRFPSAFMCGQQFILAGPHINGAIQQFQIWVLDMTSMVWTKIESGAGLSRGSWLRGMLCDMSNKFMVFGHPGRIMQEDYKSRVHCFEYVASVDIEVFGIYRPPQPSFSTIGQSLGLSMLKDPIMADLRIVTTDNKTVTANSAILAQRWPLVRPLLDPITTPHQDALDMLDLDNRALAFPDTHFVLIAFLQFIYTDHLVTAQQHQPQILSRLLFLGDLFKINRLKKLATHALHQMLNMSTAAMIYESASLSNATSLQIRSLRVLINAKKIMQRKQRMQQAEHTSSPLPMQEVRVASPSELLQRPVQDVSISTVSLASMSQQPIRPLINGAPLSPPQSLVSFSRQRSLSDRSIPDMMTPGASPTPSNTRSLKLTTFLGRQSPPSTVYNEKEHSPVSNRAPSPVLAPNDIQSAETLIKNSNTSKTHFWRHNTVTTKKKKVENRSFGFSLNK
ncbi:unnamed protein product [Rhizopus stolonifer]